MSRIWRWWLGWVERHIVADDPWEAADRQRAAVARHPAMRARWADVCPVCGGVIRRGPVDEHVCEATVARRRRRDNPAAAEQARRESRIRSRALAVLACRHRREFEDILRQMRDAS